MKTEEILNIADKMIQKIRLDKLGHKYFMRQEIAYCGWMLKMDLYTSLMAIEGKQNEARASRQSL